MFYVILRDGEAAIMGPARWLPIAEFDESVIGGFSSYREALERLRWARVTVHGEGDGVRDQNRWKVRIQNRK